MKREKKIAFPLHVSRGTFYPVPVWSRKPWQPESVLLFCGAQLLCFSAGIVAAVLLHKSGLAAFQHEDGFGNSALMTLCLQGATWLLIPLVLRRNEVRWRDFFGLRKENLLRSLGWAAASFLVVLPVALGLESACSFALQKIGWEPQPEAAVKLLLETPVWPTGIYLGFFAVVLAPVAEEFIFRGVLFPFVRQLGFPRLAWLGVSGLFALIHGGAAIFIPLLVLALVLTWLYEKTGSLLAPIAVHSLFNTANLVLLVLANHFGLELPAQP